MAKKDEKETMVTNLTENQTGNQSGNQESGAIEGVKLRLESLVHEYEEKLKSFNRANRAGNGIKFIGKASDDDYVELCLFRDGGKYKDDVFVGINGKMCRVKRGVPVKIKRSFARVIASSQESAANVQAKMSENDGKMIHI